MILKSITWQKWLYTKYAERLTILEAETLELRRLKADIMYIYKIVFGLLDGEPGTLDIK